jgi:4-hydroxy-4-methyl-2-oxoglutarate aldolase
MNLKELAGVSTTHLSDALDDLAIPNCVIGGFNYLGPQEYTAIGPAFTLKQEVVAVASEAPKGSARHGEATQELAAPGDVLVIDVGGDTSMCSWGEAHTLRAMARGLGGVLINGATRDSAGISRRAFPLSCLGYSPVRSAGRLRTTAVGRPVHIGKLTIRPGDIVALDRDGVVCVPAEFANDVLAKAQHIRDHEIDRDRELEAKLRR